MDTESKLRYSESIGKHARMASEMAMKGDLARSAKHAAKAGEERDLMHPMAWAGWRGCPVEPFEAAMAHLSPREASILEKARSGNGCSVGLWMAAGEDPERAAAKLRILSVKGVDWDAARSSVGSMRAEVGAGVALASLGFVGGMCALSRVGFPAPGKLTIEQSEALSPGGSARCALHLLAAKGCSTRPWAGWEALAKEALAWLASGHPLSARDSQGRDALKIAIDHGHESLALACLDAGLDPRSADAKGRTAIDTLDRRCKAAKAQREGALADRLMAIRGRLIAATERLEFAALAGTGQGEADAGKKPRRGL